MALPLPAAIAAESPDNDPARLAPHRIKRCTYRRLVSLDRARERIYEVECLFPDRKVPVPAGRPRRRDAGLQLVHGGAHLPARRGLSAARSRRLRLRRQRGGL